MIIVHNIFVCKPGNAGKMAKMMKESMKTMPHFKMIMTDMTGQYHRVISVAEYEDLTAYQKSLEAMENPTTEMKEAMKDMGNMNEMYISGSREIYKVW